MNRRQLLTRMTGTWLAGSMSPRLWAAASAVSSAEDMAIFRAAMEIHPGLYRYSTSQEISGGLDVLERDYRTGLASDSPESCYLALSRFLTSIRCGHSYCNFFNQNDPHVEALFDRATRLPFYFEWLGDAMIVTADHSHTGALPPGTSIRTLNGVPVAEVQKTLLAYTRADGHNNGKRRSLLGVRGAEAIEFFDVFQGLVLPPKDATHHLDIVTPNGVQRSVIVPAVRLAARRAAMTRVSEDSDQPRWKWTVRKDGVAVLDMPGWAMWNSKWPWRAWLEDRLDSLAGAKGLVIDIRQNEGGDDCGDPILARLIDHELKGWDFQERLRFTRVPDVLSPHVSTWDDSFRTLGVGARPLSDGFYERPGATTTQPIQPAKSRIAIPVAALIGPANSSATFGFINAAKASGRVRLFGEPTGGNRRGINGGAFFFVKLPGSGIEFDLPLVGYYPPTAEQDAGLDPDAFISKSADDIAHGKDPAMEAALTWIRKRRNA